MRLVFYVNDDFERQNWCGKRFHVGEKFEGITLDTLFVLLYRWMPRRKASH